MEDDFVLGLDAFVRSIRINRATPHALLIGAGASISGHFSPRCLIVNLGQKLRAGG
jgi:hypothetical protein